MSILCLTGWQQQATALSVIAPGATHFDYAAYDNVDTALGALPREPDLAIGWSLGGELLVHAVARGLTKPGTLLLLGAPYQYIKNARFAHGTEPAVFDHVRAQYSEQPEAMLAQFNTLVGLGDVHARRIIRTLSEGVEVWPNGLFWLDTLAKISCDGLNFLAFPKTMIVHGAQDRIVNPASMEAFARALPQAETLLWDDCGHAPHLHNTEYLRKLVADHV